MATKSNPRLIFTYGTLKRGFSIHRLMEALISVGAVVFVVEYTTADSFPFVCRPHEILYLINIPESGNRVRGKLYEVNENGIGPLDDLEGIGKGHCERLPVNVVGDGGDKVAAEAYFGRRSFGKGCGRNVENYCESEEESIK